MNEARSTDRQIEKVYGEDGQLIAEAEFNSEGKLDGVERHWNLAGQQILEASYRNGLHDGPYRSWWDTGEVKEVGQYRNGQRVGLYTWYSADGEKVSEHDYGGK
ncbi:toxin-antitoxin system YwqK family antitoxin [Lentisalinibacter salinarum]|uniref:toxin-antitoxin system YwqK family antitoxin n=1 Tax=Lentisalinibacter salinarum TaxID=2992239 RepID=UPI00386B22D1